MKKKLLFVVLAFLFSALPSFAQSVIKGNIVDQDTKEPLIGVTVMHEDTKEGTTTDFDGNFSLKVKSMTGKLSFSYIGYEKKESAVKSNLGVIELKPSSVGLSDVIITSTIGVDRKTPVAMSNIEAEVIMVKLGTREFPEILKSTPGIYASKQGGGFGDSRLNLRGFESENIAVMINGVPMNDMEWGGIYWSNWAGLSDVTRIMQVQRGLGASKVAAPSIGGSINIMTKSIDAKKGGSVYYGLGNSGYNKMSVNVSTGLMDNGWAVTLLGAKTWGDGYVKGTDFESYSYFANISKVINSHHQLSLTAFGAPQWHHQRKDQLLISGKEGVGDGWAQQPEDSRFQYNAGYGYDDSGNFKTFNRNTYHKPQISLNHIWDINEKSSLSTAVYLSLGNGGGYSGMGYQREDAYGSSSGLVNTKYRRIDGTYDFGKLMQENYTRTNYSGSDYLYKKDTTLVIQNGINNHVWVGLLSTYAKELTKEIKVQGGIDLRYYKGTHTNKIADLLGAKYALDPQRAVDGKFKNDWEWASKPLTVGDIVYRDNDGFVMQEGLFGQGEYSKDKLSTFVAAAANMNNYWRVERFTADNVKSETITKIGYSIKGGANYNLTDNHNVFANIGYFSRTPFFGSNNQGGIFLAKDRSNTPNKDAKNEKVFSVELGYGYRSKILTANVNIYNTAWNDKSIGRALDPTNPNAGMVNLSGVNALHQGIEVDLKARPTRALELTAMLSLGNWLWKDVASGYMFDGNGNAVDKLGNVVTPGSPDHVQIIADLDEIHVGNSAQTTIALGANYEVFKGMRVGLDYNYYGRNYASYKVEINTLGLNKFVQPWQMPNANVVDFNFNYKFQIGNLNSTLYGNIDNILDAIYITDASNGSDGTWKTAKVYYGFGRTWSIGMKVFF